MKLLGSKTFQDGKKRLLQFTCGHFLVIPYDKMYWTFNRNCPACKVSRTHEENKLNILMRYPELEEYLNQEIFVHY